MAAASTATITVTGTFGPGLSLTSKVFTDVSDIDFQIERSVLSITAGGKIVDIDLYLIVTVTYTVASHHATVAVS